MFANRVRGRRRTFVVAPQKIAGIQLIELVYFAVSRWLFGATYHQARNGGYPSFCPSSCIAPFSTRRETSELFHCDINMSSLPPRRSGTTIPRAQNTSPGPAWGSAEFDDVQFARSADRQCIGSNEAPLLISDISICNYYSSVIICILSQIVFKYGFNSPSCVLLPTRFSCNHTSCNSIYQTTSSVP